MPLFTPLKEQLSKWSDETPTTARQEALEPLARWIGARTAQGKRANIIFVCTHNSRRSHISQIWAQAAAHHMGLSHVVTWSGGTEATAFNPRAVRAMRDAGVRLEDTGRRVSGENVVYRATYGAELDEQDLFSKVYTDLANPQEGFAAVMVCDSADAACPLVIGADLRVRLPFIDPKRADDTPEEALIYAESAQEIGLAVAWLMRRASVHSA